LENRRLGSERIDDHGSSSANGRTGFLTHEGFDGYIWGNFRQFSVVSNVVRRFTPTQAGTGGLVRVVDVTDRTIPARATDGWRTDYKEP
jgi:hypothetical protein